MPRFAESAFFKLRHSPDLVDSPAVARLRRKDAPMPAPFPPATPLSRLLAAIPCLLFALLLPVAADTPPADPLGSAPAEEMLLIPTCQGDFIVSDIPVSAAPALAAAADPEPPAPHSTIDVAVFYTPGLRIDLGGTQPIRAGITRLIADSNQIFHNSGVHLTLNLVAAHEVYYEETGDKSIDLSRFRNKNEGYMDRVHLIREQTRADLMVLLHSPFGGEAPILQVTRENIANAARGAFAISGMYELTFTHEIGHLMGLNHDRHTLDCQTINCRYTAQFPYGYGYVNLRGLEPGAPQSARWFTVMSYAWLCMDLGIDCEALPRFSNPRQHYNGDPLGIPSTATAVGRDGPADAARALNNVRTVAADFRTGEPSTTLTAALGNPAPDSPQSGIGLVSGWACEATEVIIEFAFADGRVMTFPAAVGTQRTDTIPNCGHADTGFGLTWNWNIMGDGTHTVRAYVDGVLLDERTVTVTTLGLGDDFPEDLSGHYVLDNFPHPGDTTSIEWSQQRQNFVIAGSRNTPDEPGGWVDGRVGILGNPWPGTAHSGVAIISGWHCTAQSVTLELLNGNTGAVITTKAGAGTERGDTAGVCGDTDNGFGLLWNWNILGDGWHTVRAFADEEPEPFSWSRVFVTTLGLGEFPEEPRGEYTLDGFPAPGQAVTVEWRREQQNFVITGVE